MFHQTAQNIQNDQLQRQFTNQTRINQNLRSLKREDLIKVMVNMGNLQKESECEYTQFITQDLETLNRIVDTVTKKIEEKKRNLKHFEDQSKNYELEISAVERAIQVAKDKLSHKKEQWGKGQAFVKKQREELKGIVKKITKDLVKKTYKMLDNETPDKICSMLEAMVGLMRNSKSVNCIDVELYLKNYDGLIYKLTSTDPTSVSEEVATKHFDTLKTVNKFFTDRDDPHFKKCSMYTPYLAWANQFYYLIQHAKSAEKVENSVKKIEREIEDKEQKKIHSMAILETFKKDDYVGLFKREIEQDAERLKKLRELRDNLVDEVISYQQHYLRFDKNFFSDLEEYVKAKKQKTR